MKTFKVRADSGADWEEMEAPEAECAAEMFAEEYDVQGDYALSKGEEIQIEVMDDKGKVRIFDCSAEAITNYYAFESIK